MDTEKNIDLGETRLLELKENKNALLVGVYKSKNDKNICLENLDELESLASTYGLTTIDKMSAPLRKIESATYLGSGKVEEIKNYGLQILH